MENKEKRGMQVGGAAAGLGGLGMLAGKVVGDNVKGDGLFYFKRYGKESVNDSVKKASKVLRRNPEKLARGLKKTGAGVALAGSALAGVSAYKHYKNKKKDDTDKK